MGSYLELQTDGAIVVKDGKVYLENTGDLVLRPVSVDCGDYLGILVKPKRYPSGPEVP